MKIYKVFLLVLFVSTSCNAHSGITVKKKLETDLEQYRNAYVDVQNDKYKTLEKRRQGEEVTFVSLNLSKALREIGINPNSNEKTAKLKVECHFRHGWGVPRLIRHFKLKTKYITVVNIKFVDAGSRRIIGEIEYNRPRLNKNPKNFIKIMFEKLIKTSPAANEGW